jgi:hypothetical protein
MAGNAMPNTGAGSDAAVTAGGARTDGAMGGMVGATPDAPAPTTGSGEFEDPDPNDAGVVPNDKQSGCDCSVPGARHGQRPRILDWTLPALFGLALSRRRRRQPSYRCTAPPRSR